MNHESEDSPSAWVDDAIRRHGPPLTCYARSIVHRSDSASDCVQDTFIRMAQRPRKPDDILRPWLFKVCRNRCLDWLRKEKRMKPLGTYESALKDDTSAPDQVAEVSDTTRTVLALIDELTPTQREVMRLKYQAGMSYQEIADVTGRSVNHVGVILHESMQALRQNIRRHSDLLGAPLR
ncbi:MAG TPA: sigma-70 family RNA polymerase sigma factor [Opitutales bacterium]|nr:sigma-70 family RNA polymerase sigma factor [Opitutales bacterium]